MWAFLVEGAINVRNTFSFTPLAILFFRANINIQSSQTTIPVAGEKYLASVRRNRSMCFLGERVNWTRELLRFAPRGVFLDLRIVDVPIPVVVPVEYQDLPIGRDAEGSLAIFRIKCRDWIGARPPSPIKPYRVNIIIYL